MFQIGEKCDIYVENLPQAGIVPVRQVAAIAKRYALTSMSRPSLILTKWNKMKSQNVLIVVDAY